MLSEGLLLAIGKQWTVVMISVSFTHIVSLMNDLVPKLKALPHKVYTLIPISTLSLLEH